jgi:hypothetical protein
VVGERERKSARARARERWFKQQRTSGAACLPPLLRGLKATKCIWVIQNYSTNLQQKAMCRKAPKKYASPSIPTVSPSEAQQNTTYDLLPVHSPLPPPPPPGSTHARRCNALLCARQSTWPIVNGARSRASSPRGPQGATACARTYKFEKNKTSNRQLNTPSSTPRDPPRQHSKEPPLAALRHVLPSVRVPNILRTPGAGRTRSPSSHKAKR